MFTKLKSKFESLIHGDSYDEVVSLGSNCEVTWNIRNYFHTSIAYPFDWWMTPFNSLLMLLDDRFSGLFDANNIWVPEDCGTVVDTYYNIMYHHDFPRTQDGLVDKNKVESQLDELKQKYAFLSHRFLQDLAGKHRDRRACTSVTSSRCLHG